MAVQDFPSIVAESQDFGIRYNTQVSTSTLNGSIQTIELPGARWAGSLGYRDLTVAESAEFKAFLLRLRGSAGRFYYGDYTHSAPFTTITGSTVVNAGSTRSVIETTVTTGSFSVGDYIQIGTDESRELKMVIAASNISNVWDLTIEPPIRRATFIGQSVVYNNPTGVFLLSSSDQAKWASRSKAQLSDIQIDFVEGFA